MDDSLRVLVICDTPAQAAEVRAELPAILHLPAVDTATPAVGIAITVDELILGKTWEFAFHRRSYDLGVLVLGKASSAFVANHAVLRDDVHGVLFIADRDWRPPGTWRPRPRRDDVLVRPFTATVLRSRMEALLLHGRQQPAGLIEESRILDLLRHCIANSVRLLRPVLDPLHAVGWYWPEVAEQLSLRVDDREVLERLVGQGLARRRVAERLRTCAACSSWRLNFRRSCPRCGGVDFTGQTLVRHLLCGHSAPLAAFTAGARLICPGCKRELSAPGRDHERIAQGHQCRECQAEFIEPKVEAECLRCGAVCAPEQTTEQLLHTYELTALADEAVVLGRIGPPELDGLLHDAGTGLSTRPYFIHELRREQLRQRRYRSPSSLVLLRLNSLEELRTSHPGRAQDYLGTIIGAAAKDLRNLDLACLWAPGTLALLLPATSLDGAQVVVHRLLNLAANLESIRDLGPPDLSAAALPLSDDDQSPEELLDSAVASLDGGED